MLKDAFRGRVVKGVIRAIPQKDGQSETGLSGERRWCFSGQAGGIHAGGAPG